MHNLFHSSLRQDTSRAWKNWVEVTTDFRHLFGEIAVGHLGVPTASPLFPGFTLKTTAFPGTL